MNKLLKNKKLISINIIILTLFILTIPTIVFCYDRLKYFLENLTSRSFNPIIKYPIFTDKKATNEILFQISRNRGKYIYKAFLGWRSKHINLKHINIKGKYNTRYSTGEKLDNSTWFFGGSTMWGSGVSDKGTIPSIYNEKTKQAVFNFGERDWNSRQSLNQLISLLGDGHRPSKIIFYDGINDVLHGCRSENQNIPTHNYEVKISSLLSSEKNIFVAIKNSFINSYMEFARKISSKLPSTNKSSGYDCHINKIKAQRIASNMVNNWYSAYLISRPYKTKFYSILQPHLLTSQTNFDYMKSSEKALLPSKRRQFEMIYPMVKKEIKLKCKSDREFCTAFLNAADWIKPNSKVYMDFCHLNKKGNEMIVEQIIKKTR